MVHSFDFRVLRQNRRVVQDESRRQQIEHFHEVLTDISYCECTPAVRAFIVMWRLFRTLPVRRQYRCIHEEVRVVSKRTVLHRSCTVLCLYECSVETKKRRYRDAWNRAVTRRLSRVHNHSLKIKVRTCRLAETRTTQRDSERSGEKIIVSVGRRKYEPEVSSSLYELCEYVICGLIICGTYADICRVVRAPD